MPISNVSPNSLINPSYRLIVNTAVGATGAACVAVFSPSETLRIIGLTVLTGVGYGIANDMIACRDCIEYFTVGHIYDEKRYRYRLLKTLDPSLNALAWGMVATWHVCAIAGVLIAIVARAPFPGLKTRVSSAMIFPYLALGAAFTLLISHFKSRAMQKIMINKPISKYPEVPIDLQPGWEACNVRNLIGYISLGVSVTALLVALVLNRLGIIKI